MGLLWKCLCLLTLIQTISGSIFQYSDLVALNVSCGAKDNCAPARNSRFTVALNWRERNCFCDDLCTQYGDCCLDAASYDPKSQHNHLRKDTCVELRNYGGVYLRKSCAPGWTGSAQVRSQCLAANPEGGSPRPDPLLGLPATSRDSHVTYANYYCALCSNDADDLDMWSPRVECPTLKSAAGNMSQADLRSKLEFVDDYWGVKSEDGYSRCAVDPFMPVTVADKVRLCKESIDYCPASFKNSTIAKLCDSYTALVYDINAVYRNYHCSLCHGVPMEHLSCFWSRELTRFNFRDDFNPSAFSLLFDFYDPTNQSSSVGFRCDRSEIWDPFFMKCRAVSCQRDEFSFINGECVLADVKTEDVTESNKSIGKVSYDVNGKVDVNDTHKSKHIILLPDEVGHSTMQPEMQLDDIQTSLNCNKILLSHDEFEEGEDGWIMVSKYHRDLNASEYENTDSGVLICVFDSIGEQYSLVMGIISVTGLGVSILCLVFHLTAFCLVKDLRNLSGKNLACLCVSLLAAYSCFVLGIFGEEGTQECVVLASLMYYFFLASFCWMNVMAFDVWRTLQLATRELRVSGGGQWMKFLVYSAYAWCVPAVALAIVLSIDANKTEGMSAEYLPEMGQRLCWFGQRKALLVFFGLPLTVIMIINLVCFGMTAFMISQAAKSTAKFSDSQPHQNNFVLYTKLALLMGLGWVSGILAGYVQEEFLWYIFILLNTLQGLFIFIAFTCKRRVLEVFCCSRSLPMFSVPAASDRQNLDSRDSTHSHLSNTSERKFISATDSNSISF